ncbi:hypothetical protein LPJ53_001149 [Coemansia erecta]|uniref:Uncharacterized protein n=1 Tax=Coemansia erecta TaxID=147472 RepID=A0A9W7Y619_9FUNG|nr:hypothetical protein LPJ53_001149 [Coemansia erecta]
MPALSTQVAYLLHLADTASSDRIRLWTSESLDELIAWARHADLIMPTLAATDRSAVLRHAADIQPPNAITSPVLDLLAESTIPCLSTLLLRVIANPDTPDHVRIAAIHKAAEDIREQCRLKEENGGLDAGGSGTAAVSLEITDRLAQTLQPLQSARRIAKINSVLASGMQSVRQDTSAECIAETEFLMAPDTPRTISVALALLHAAESAAPAAVEQMAAEIFRQHDQAPEPLHNAALFAALHARSSPALQYAITSSITSRLTTPSLRTAEDAAIRYCTSLNPYLLAKLSSIDDSFADKYLAQLLWMNKCCQLAMLGEYIGMTAPETDSLAASDAVVAGLVDRWQKVSGQLGCRSKVVCAMRKDRARFDALRNCPEAMVDNPAFEAIVEFWNALYDQFLA